MQAINPDSKLLAPVFSTIRVIEYIRIQTAIQDIFNEVAESSEDSDIWQTVEDSVDLQYSSFKEQSVIICNLHQHLKSLNEDVPRLWVCVLSRLSSFCRS